jgi:hypothetical protein
MNRHALQLVVATLVGIVAATLFHSFRQPEDVTEAPARNALIKSADDTLVSEPPFSMESRSPEEGGGSDTQREPSPQAMISAYEGEVSTFTKQREIERLRKAGFSDDRIAWLEQRTAELQSLSRSRLNQQPPEGKTTAPYERISYILDPDLDLRDEIGEEEYDRYRQALGRPLGVAVMDVSGGSAGEASGILPGDEIVRYDGKRVYNVAMLDNMTTNPPAEEFAIVEVIRRGQRVQLTIPKGQLASLGVRSESPAQAFNRTRPEVFH